MPEQQPQEFDVGRIVRDYQAKFVGTSPNLAMPATMVILLAELEDLTRRLEERDEGISPQVSQDLTRWRARLDGYHEALAKAPSLDDRQAILWTVTAPLLLGWYGGPTGTEVELTPGGFPPGFNTDHEHTADLATPFSLANQMGVAEEWDRRRLDLLGQDLKEAALKRPLGVHWGWWVAGGVGVVGLATGVAIAARGR